MQSMPGPSPSKPRPMPAPSPCPAMILPAKFTKKVPDSMNFVNFAGKRQGFQEASLRSRALLAGRARPRRGAAGAAAGSKLTLRAPGPIPAAHPMESL